MYFGYVIEALKVTSIYVFMYCCILCVEKNIMFFSKVKFV
jgi:hypothetical protein